MSLLDVRTKFVEATGRYDLVLDPFNATPDYGDAGADWFIQQGQKYLDRRLHDGNALAELTIAIAQADYFKDIANVRAVLNARMSKTTDTEGVFFLQKRTFRELVDMLGDFDDFSALDEGFPEFYALGSSRNIGTPTAATETGSRIYFIPPADGTYSMILRVIHESIALSVDTDVNYWTEAHPQALILASILMLEQHYNNLERQKATSQSLMDYLKGIDFDAVKNEMSDDTIREDWWNEQRIY